MPLPPTGSIGTLCWGGDAEMERSKTCQFLCLPSQTQILHTTCKNTRHDGGRSLPTGKSWKRGSEGGGDTTEDRAQEGIPESALEAVPEALLPLRAPLPCEGKALATLVARL